MPPIEPGQAVLTAQGMLVHAALHAPVAPFSWEFQADLDGDTERTARIPLRFTRPVQILGFYPSVIRNAALGALENPTTEHVLCLLHANREIMYTNRLESGQGAQVPENFVTLASLGVQVPRLVNIQLRQGAPELAAEFRWKRWNAAFEETPVYPNAIVTLTAFARYLTEEEIVRAG
jgi:hypothetical protein